jgi:hypothetical protein
MKSFVMKHPSMTRSLHTDPTGALMQARNPLVFGGPDNKPADRIVEARCASASAAHSDCSILTAIEADAAALLLLAQCVP